MLSFVPILFIVLAMLASIQSIPYEVIVSMDENTVSSLQKQGFHLYLFKGVKASVSASSMVWIKQDLDSDFLKFHWEDSYNGYISPQDINPGTVIDEFTSQALEGGQIAEISSNSYSSLLIDETTVGGEQKYYLRNKLKEPIIGGLTQAHGLVQSPICAVSIPAGENNLVEMTPLPRVYLTFSTEDHRIGKVLTNTTTAGLLLDMSAHSHIAVSFDIVDGWTDIHFPYAAKIQPKQPFHSFLNMLSN
jgi:hypothetical protein